MVLKRFGQLGAVMALTVGAMSLGVSLLGAPRLSSGAVQHQAPTLLDEQIKLTSGSDAVVHEVMLSDGTPCVAVIGKTSVAVACGWPTAPTPTAIPSAPLQ